MSEHMDRYTIRALAREHFLREWHGDGWQVDETRGEICVGDSWFPVEALPRILSNHMEATCEREQAKKHAMIFEEKFAEAGNTWQSRARRLAAELEAVKAEQRSAATERTEP